MHKASRQVRLLVKQELGLYYQTVFSLVASSFQLETVCKPRGLPIHGTHIVIYSQEEDAEFACSVPLGTNLSAAALIQ